jgi:hypothetical protein
LTHLRRAVEAKEQNSVTDLVEQLVDDGAAQARRSVLERAVLVPAGALLVAAEDLLGLAATLADAEKAGRELAHFEERGARARTDFERIVRHHRGRLADRLDLRIDQARNYLNAGLSKSGGITSKIRPQMPKQM